MSEQIHLIPSVEYNLDDKDAYLAAEWKWVFGEVESEWFMSRDEAWSDAENAYPGIGIG